MAMFPPFGPTTGLLLLSLACISSCLFGQDSVPGRATTVSGNPAKKQPTTEKESIGGRTMESLVATMNKKAWRHGRLRAMRTVAAHANRPLDHLEIYKAALAEDDWAVRASVVQCFGTIAGRYPGELDRILPHLIPMLEDQHLQVKQQTIWTLRKIGPPAKDSLAKLERIAKTDTNEEIARYAASACLDVAAGSDQHLPYLLDFIKTYPTALPLNHINRFRTSDAAPLLANALIDSLRELVDSPNVDPVASVHQQASILRSFYPMGIPVEGSRELLMRLIESPVLYSARKTELSEDETSGPFIARTPVNHSVRIRAALAIAKVFPEARSTMFETLEGHLSSEDPVLRFAALTTIDRISFCEEARSTLDRVRQLKQDSELIVRQVARLVELRIESGPEKTNYRSDYIYLEAPEIDERSPTKEVARTALAAKLDEFRKAADARDFYKLNALMQDPADLASSLIQNVSSNRDPRIREELFSGVAPIILAARLDDFEIRRKKAIATVKLKDRRMQDRQFRLECQWYDGQWYLKRIDVPDP